MKDKNTIQNSIFPYSVSARCINKEWFGMAMDDVWSIMEDYLFFVANAYSLKIHSFVLMSNHFHLLATAPQNNLGEAMQYLLAQSSRVITKSVNRINHTWRANYFRCLITSDRYYLHAYKYFYRNPVEAQICQRVEDYPYSTLPGILGLRRLVIPVETDELLVSDFEKTLEWLNTEPPSESRASVQKALRKPFFKLPRDRTGRRNFLEENSY